MNEAEFTPFPKIARLSREMLISEKIDGTNGLIRITEAGDMMVGSRSRWITVQEDNYGFAKWAEGNKQELLKLGPGRHFGEWWGNGCQRGYGLPKGEKRFSLFNIQRWCPNGQQPKRIPTGDPKIEKWQQVLPQICHLVPLLYEGVFCTRMAGLVLENLKASGSLAAPGFMDPEGIIVWCTAANVGFKKTIKNDDLPKSISI